MSKTHREQTVLQIIESLRRVFKTFQTASQELQGTLGITMAQSWALFSIKDRKSLTLAELSKMMFVRPSTASVVVDKLVEKGYVAKRRTKKDQRSIAIALTPSGEAFLEKVPRLSVSNLARGLENLDNENLEMINVSMRKLVDILHVEDLKVTFIIEDPPDAGKSGGHKSAPDGRVKIS